MTTNNTYEIIEISTGSWLEGGTPELITDFGTATDARRALIIHNALCVHHNQWDGSIIIIQQGDESRTDILHELVESDGWDIASDDVINYLVEMGYSEEEAYTALTHGD